MMNPVHQTQLDQSYEAVNDLAFYQQQQQQQGNESMMIQQQNYLMAHQLELERLRQIQEQAAIQQQRVMLQQQMLAYQQQIQSTNFSEGSTDYLSLPNGYSDYSPNMTASSPTSHHYHNEEVPVNKAQKRAEHNAIERARRESLNTKFQQLAHYLPNLQDDRRPSKGTIIERTLEYVRQTVQKEERFQNEIDKLRQANEDLISKMTSQHFGQYETIHEENDREEEEVNEDDGISATPECDDNFSSRSSVTSISSQPIYSLMARPSSSTNPIPSSFEKQQQDASSAFLMSRVSNNLQF
ncbi:MAG: hypothetical protein EXX96DRAFT_514443 [Benjaminiella poitrasii]|nr:MAG: hypothetical protein EXX96DRAFT_514443 [Benjaminiella poitrasii]